ncbi:MAG: hypothetical protein KAS96_10590, partial [Planctomycetes bacterium]|nr:hypothetical protein [Planctomycetota bacterium]
MKTEKVISTVFITMVIFVLCGSALGEPVFCAVGWFGEFAHIDPDIGVVTPIRNDLPSGLQALAWSPDGILYAGRENDIYKIDPRTGNYEHYLSITVDIRGMAISPSGVLYVTSEHTSSQAFGAINLETGAYTDIGLLWGDLTKAQGMAFSPNGVLYGIHPSRPSFKLFTIDLDDAETHLITDSLSTVGVNQSLSFTHEGALYAIGEEIFAQIDPTDGSVIEPIALSGCGECEFRGLALISNNNYDYYVNANGTGDYPTIQVAIDVASDGETVVAADGVYKGEGNRDIDFRGKAITVKSENGPENCVIDCETLGRGFYFQTNEGRDSILDGFTIINGRTDEMRYGGGIGAKNISSPTIRNCIVTECVAQNGGGGIASSGARIENCLILGNYAGWAGGGLWTDHSSVEIINCTVVDNKARDYGHGSCHWQDGHTSIINSIFWNEGNSEIYVRLSTISVSYSNVKNGFSGAGNIDADPCFVDASSGNYYLLADSLCIDTGDPNYIAEANETDLAGNPRILNDRIDMGTYEFVTTPAKPAPIYEVIDIGTGYVYALGINEKDEVVGHIKPNGSWSGSYAFYWNKESGLQSIGGRRARSINDLGQIAGQSASIQAGVWENGEWITLSNRQEAYAINNNGQVTGLISAQPSIPGPYAPFRDDNIYSPDFITLQRPYLRASHGFNIN